MSGSSPAWNGLRWLVTAMSEMYLFQELPDTLSVLNPKNNTLATKDCRTGNVKVREMPKQFVQQIINEALAGKNGWALRPCAVEDNPLRFTP